MNPIESDKVAMAPLLPDLLHPGSRAVLRYWELIRGERSVPTRSDLDLRKIANIVPWLCILERNPVRQAYRWRLAGTGICLLWCRDLTGGEFLDEWRAAERPLFGGVLDRVIATLQPCVARSQAISLDGSAVKIEMLGVPIRSSASNQVQILGSHPAARGSALARTCALAFAGPAKCEPHLDRADPRRAGRPSVKPPNRRARQRRLHRHPGRQEQVLTQALPGRRSIDPSSFPPHPLTRHLRIESHKPRKTAVFRHIGEPLVNTSSTPNDSAAGLGEAGGGTTTWRLSGSASTPARSSRR